LINLVAEGSPKRLFGETAKIGEEVALDFGKHIPNVFGLARPFFKFIA
jgi:hypothetical protein